MGIGTWKSCRGPPNRCLRAPSPRWADSEMFGGNLTLLESVAPCIAGRSLLWLHFLQRVDRVLGTRPGLELLRPDRGIVRPPTVFESVAVNAIQPPPRRHAALLFE